MEIDFETCRTCLVKFDVEKLNYLFSKLENKTVDEILEECTSIHVTKDDTLPQFICIKCLDKLRDFYNFRNICLNSNEKLKENSEKILENFKIESDLNDPLLTENNILDDTSIDIKIELGSKNRLRTLINNKRKKKLKEKPFACHICPKKFKTKKVLNLHLKKKHNIKIVKKPKLIKSIINFNSETGLYFCDICPNTYKTYPCLARHKKDHLEPRFYCDICEKGFAFRPKMIEHRKLIHEGVKEYCCEFCSKIFGRRSHLNRHQKSVHSKQAIYKCKFCEEKFFYARDLEKHIKSLHEDVTVTRESLREMSENFCICKICGEKFSKRTYLYHHNYFKHKNQKKIENDSNELENSKENNLIDKNSTMCDFCNKPFAGKMSLNAHIYRVHRKHNENNQVDEQIEDDERYLCEICNGTFKRFGYVKIHLKSHNLNFKDYNVDNLNQLILKFKEIQNGYVCGTCQETFPDKIALFEHLKQHKFIIYYNCNLCEKIFTNYLDLSVHQKFIHGIGKICTNIERNDKIQPASVENGVKKYVCEFCQKSFNKVQYLKAHRRIHLNIKKFKCEYCDKTFVQSPNLKDHILTHTGERPFECDKCGKTFIRKYNLKIHQNNNCK